MHGTVQCCGVILTDSLLASLLCSYKFKRSNQQHGTFYDIMFFIKALKQPSNHFNMYDHVSFSTANTRSSSNNKLNHVYTSNNYTRNFYFNRISRLWNKLPSIDLSQPLSVIKVNIYKYLHQHFTVHFSADNPCTYHFCCRCSNCYNVAISRYFSFVIK